MATEEPTLRGYIIFAAYSPPQRVYSSMNLLQQWLSQMEERSKTGEWWRPIEFKEEGGKTVAAYSAYQIISIIEGEEVPPTPKDGDAVVEMAEKAARKAK